MDLTQSTCCHMLGVSENAPLSRDSAGLSETRPPTASGRCRGRSVRFSEITAAYNVLTGRCAAAKTQTPPSGATATPPALRQRKPSTLEPTPSSAAVPRTGVPATAAAARSG
jgi:hypothetical protein